MKSIPELLKELYLDHPINEVFLRVEIPYFCANPGYWVVVNTNFKSCDCGASKTNNPTLHVSWCSTNEV